MRNRHDMFSRAFLHDTSAIARSRIKCRLQHARKRYFQRAMRALLWLKKSRCGASDAAQKMSVLSRFSAWIFPHRVPVLFTIGDSRHKVKSAFPCHGQSDTKCGKNPARKRGKSMADVYRRQRKTARHSTVLHTASRHPGCMCLYHDDSGSPIQISGYRRLSEGAGCDSASAVSINARSLGWLWVRAGKYRNKPLLDGT